MIWWLETLLKQWRPQGICIDCDMITVGKYVAIFTVATLLLSLTACVKITEENKNVSRAQMAEDCAKAGGSINMSRNASGVWIPKCVFPDNKVDEGGVHIIDISGGG